MNTKWNRFLSLLLSIMLLACVTPSLSMAETSNDDELSQAFASGLAPDIWSDQLGTPMAINDFCALMMRIIEPFDASLLPEWESLAGTALGSTREMKREDAMIAVYQAACLMGQGRDTTGDWLAVDALLSQGEHFWELSNEYPEWNNLDNDAPFCTDCDKIIGGAYHFAQGQVSLLSGKRVFDLDEENKDLHMLDPLTKGEALLILQRFGESLKTETTDVPEETVQTEEQDDELSQAFASGLAPDVWGNQLDTPMAINDFCALMMRIIEPYDASLLPEWESLAGTALGSTREMKREDAMMAVYEAACIMGQAVCNGDWGAVDITMGEGDHAWELSWDYPDWANAMDTSPFCEWGDTYVGGAYHFAQGQVSLISGKRVFDLDEENKDLHMLDPLTKGEALLILQRFGESLSKQTDADTMSVTEPTNADDTASSLPVSASDDEIALGVFYGLLDSAPVEPFNVPMPLGEFCVMLRQIVLHLDEAALNEWDTLAAAAASSTRSMKREDAMLAVFEAACILNKAVCNDENWYAIDQQLEKGQHFWELSFDYPDWANAQDDCPFCDWGDSYMGGAYHFAEGQYSPISGNRVFDYDEEALDLHMLDLLSRGDAIAIAVRFYESIAEGSLYVQPSAEQLEIEAMIDARREEILNTPSDYNSAGRTYYVSNHGSDSNDGLSPETAWATLDKVNSAAWTWDGQLNSDDFPEYLWVSSHRKEQADIKRGDVVLLERGGLWRGSLRTVAGVTYSAYGEGEKPRIYGSPENGADESKWQLVDGTENIWLFYKPMQQTGLIVCDEDTLCLRDYAYWNGQRLIKMSSNANLPWDEVEKLPTMSIDTLTEDLHFFCDIPFVTDADYAMTGSLYLRCDAGNPGIVFSSMEFATGNNAWSEGFANVEDDTILDNLCFRFGTTGITAHDSKNAVIRNCEIAWVGGMSMETGNISDSPDHCSLTCTGDAIMLGGVNNIAQHNYITNTFDYGITVEAFYNDDDGTSTYRSGCIVSDNLLDHCNGGLLMVDWYAINHGLDREIFTDITFDNNLVAHTGENLWAHASARVNAAGQYEPELMGALALWMNPGLRNIRVTNNTFAYAHTQEPLIHLARFKEDTSALYMDGNTYMQGNGGAFLFMNEYDVGDDAYCWQNSVDFDTQRYIEEQLKDANGRIIRNITE